MGGSSRSLLLCGVAAASLLSSGSAWAGPEGGVVSGGSVSISTSGSQTNIYQSSDRAIIDWTSFDIGAGEETRFHQPSSGSIALNRIRDTKTSQINGKLSANGHVMLINPNGVVFGVGSVVDVGALTASTADIDNNDFMNGSLTFSQPGSAAGAIINYGRITAQEAGLVSLVAPRVENHGIILAKLGKVQLAAADSFTLDLVGDGLIQLAVSDEDVKKLARNSGIISAEGGTIALTASRARNLVDSIVENSGVIEAASMTNIGGKIVLGGAQTGHTVNRGVLDVSGRKNAVQGGQVNVLGQHIAIAAGSLIDASGSAPVPVPNNDQDGSATLTVDRVVRSEEEFLDDARRGGGSIKIGGDYLGSGDTPRAQTLYVDANTLTLNDGLIHGDGGRTIFWSDDTTIFNGNVFARGGAQSGNGGFLETSGKINLAANGYADLTNTAEGFNKGTYLLDPANITIYGDSSGTVGPDYVSTDGTSVDLASALVIHLDASDLSSVELTYSGADLGGVVASGTIGTNTVTTDLDVSSSLRVGSRIRIGATGSVATANTLGADTYTITAIAGNTITVAETLTGTYTNSALNRGLVSRWNDQTLEGNDSTQTNQVRMPLFTSSGNMGSFAIVHDGVNDGMMVLDLDDDLILRQGLSSGLDVHMAGFWNGFSPNRNGILGTDSSGNHVVSKSYSIGTGTGGDVRFQVNTAAVSGPGNSIETGSTLKSNYEDKDVLISYRLESDGFSNFDLEEYILGRKVSDVSVVSSAPLDQDYRSSQNFSFGARAVNNDNYVPVEYSEMFAFNKALNEGERNLLNQYQSLKWSIALDPLAGVGTEAAEAMASTAKGDASDGFGAFSTRYLEKLSATADIVLAADNTITLDLKGDTLTLADDRSISLTTTNSDITSVSAGSIVTNRTAAGGNITMTSGGNIDLADLTLYAQNGGNVRLETGAGGTLALDQAVTGGNVTLIGDEINLGAAVATNNSGSVWLNSKTLTQAIEIGSTDPNNLNLSALELGYLQDGWSSIVIGGSDHNAGIIVNEDVTFRDNTHLQNSTAYQVSVDRTADINASITTTDGANLSLTGYNTGVGIHSGIGVHVADDLNVAGNLTINSAARGFMAETNNITAGGFIDITTSSDTTLNANFISGDYFSLFKNSHQTVHLAANRTIDAGGDIRLTNGGNGLGGLINLQTGSALISDGNIELKSQGEISAATASMTTSGGNIILNADSEGDNKGAIKLVNTTITTDGGNFIAGGGVNPLTTAAKASGSYNIGIEVNNTSINTGMGNITMRGEGENTGILNHGMYFYGTSHLQTTTGLISLYGTGGAGSDENDGIRIYSPTIIESEKGDILLTGTGGNGVDNNNGIRIQGSTIRSTGTDSDAATITLNGTSGGSGVSARGIYINGLIESEKGAISLTGNGHAASTFNNDGLRINGTIRSTGSGADAATISLIGIGGGQTNSVSANYGLVLSSGAVVETKDGDLYAMGTGGGNASNISNNYGIFLDSTGAVRVESTGDANLTFEAQGSSNTENDMNINVATGSIGEGALAGTATGTITFITDGLAMSNSQSVQTAGDVVIKTRNPLLNIGLAGGSGALNLTNAELDYFTAGNKLIIGDSLNGQGDVDINNWSLGGTSYDVEIYGNDIDIENIAMGFGNILAQAKDKISDSGDLTLRGAITHNEDGDATLDLRADHNILSNATPSIIATDNNSDADGNAATDPDRLTVILNADRNADGMGYVELTNATITTLGGDFIVGGGADPYTTEVVSSFSDSGTRGIQFNTVDVDTAAGQISMLARHTGTGTGRRGIYLIDSDLTTTSGDITIAGRITGGSGSTTALELNNTNLSSATGDINMSGISSASGGNNNHGIYIYGGSTISSTSTGTVTLTGRGGNAINENRGVYILGSGTLLSSAYGNIDITADGGGSGSQNYGFSLGGGAIISSTGIGDSAADIKITGTGANGTQQNTGVLVSGSIPRISSIDGDISVFAYGGNGDSFSNVGYSASNGGEIFTSGDGNIYVTAVGGNGTNGNHGMSLSASGSRFRTNSGDIVISATGNGTGTGNHGISFSDTNATSIRPGGNLKITGNVIGTGTGTDIRLGTTAQIDPFKTAKSVTLIANSFESLGSIIGSGGDLSFLTRTAGTSIGLGGGAGTLNIDDAELAQFSVGGRLQIGTTGATGNVDIDSVDVSTGGYDMLINGGSITVNGGLQSGDKVTMIAQEDITLNSGVSANGAGSSLVMVADGRFTNNAGSGALNPGAGRYLVYAMGDAFVTKGGLTGLNVYNRTYNAYPPELITQTGNLFLYPLSAFGISGGIQQQMQLPDIITGQGGGLADFYHTDRFSDNPGASENNKNHQTTQTGASLRKKQQTVFSHTSESDADVRLIQAELLSVEQPIINFYDLCSYNVNYCQ